MPRRFGADERVLPARPVVRDELPPEADAPLERAVLLRAVLLAADVVLEAVRFAAVVALEAVRFAAVVFLPAVREADRVGVLPGVTVSRSLSKSFNTLLFAFSALRLSSLSAFVTSL